MAHFVVLSGKFDSFQNQSTGYESYVDYKYISGPHETLDLAMADFDISRDYPVNELEYHADNGKVYMLEFKEKEK